ncbi:dihydrodipicolinate synthase family protein [Thermoflexibacter ruber]|uniref:4-hydroxy-tetrahydrodipicolinate synthase n=1 Tax=Thermoflexibacter ruber TaxID=1003 RepID=A0A1I2FK40_9BACT|nr:dihydrodipicolinate synthase family protein [Thermoflexibacter ruber]SFF05655.1 4-hydroxy-tetrahydrodipicolinate synthase [Thermoflexibacter ruber]
MKFEWKGVFPALTTKFTAGEQLDLPAFEKNLQAQLEAGVDGIILGGTLGEASTLSAEEKQTLVQFAIEKINGRVPVILNIAEGSTKVAIEVAQNAQKLGADGLMILPPMRYKSDHRETVAYFKAVAQQTDLPMMIYNNPVDYKIEVTLDMFEELADCQNIQAVKESTRDVSNVTRMINRFGNRFQILCGVDTLALESLLMGADGWVAGLVCAFPKETVAIYKLAKAGRIQEALHIYRWFLPLLELDIHPKLVQYIKLAESVTGLGTEYVRSPRLTLEGAERERVLQIIREGVSKRPILPEYKNL